MGRIKEFKKESVYDYILPKQLHKKKYIEELNKPFLMEVPETVTPIGDEYFDIRSPNLVIGDVIIKARY